MQHQVQQKILASISSIPELFERHPLVLLNGESGGLEIYSNLITLEIQAIAVQFNTLGQNLTITDRQLHHPLEIVEVAAKRVFDKHPYPAHQLFLDDVSSDSQSAHPSEDALCFEEGTTPQMPSFSTPPAVRFEFSTLSFLRR